jgi:hypothetical protein
MAARKGGKCGPLRNPCRWSSVEVQRDAQRQARRLFHAVGEFVAKTLRRRLEIRRCQPISLDEVAWLMGLEFVADIFDDHGVFPFGFVTHGGKIRGGDKSLL